MALDQLDEFAAAIAELESGGSYGAMGPPTGTYGRALGKYQIMSKIWPGWAKEAGWGGASWTDPEAQEAVARFKMRQYYNRYQDWDLVAVAWFAGPGRANEVAKRGLSSAAGVSDVLGTTVPAYVKRVRSLMGSTDTSTPSQRQAGGVTAAATGPTTAVPEPPRRTSVAELQQMVTGVLTGMSEMIRESADEEDDEPEFDAGLGIVDENPEDEGLLGEIGDDPVGSAPGPDTRVSGGRV